MSDFGELPIIHVESRVEAALLHQPRVRRGVLFLHDRRVREITAQARAVHLQPLLVRMPLGEQRQLVAFAR